MALNCLISSWAFLRSASLPALPILSKKLSHLAKKVSISVVSSASSSSADIVASRFDRKVWTAVWDRLVWRSWVRVGLGLLVDFLDLVFSQSVQVGNFGLEWPIDGLDELVVPLINHLRSVNFQAAWADYWPQLSASWASLPSLKMLPFPSESVTSWWGSGCRRNQKLGECAIPCRHCTRTSLI